MSMLIALSLFVTSELSIQEDRVEEFLTIVGEGLEISRNYSGNLGFDILIDPEQSGKVLFIEQWQSEQHFWAYYNWRAERGDFEALGNFFSAPPVMHFYRGLDERSGVE